MMYITNSNITYEQMDDYLNEMEQWFQKIYPNKYIKLKWFLHDTIPKIEIILTFVKYRESVFLYPGSLWESLTKKDISAAFLKLFSPFISQQEENEFYKIYLN